MAEKDLAEIRKRLNRVEKKLLNLEKKPLTLKEKFYTHDHAQRLLREFEEILGGLPHENIWFSWVIGKTFEKKKAPIKELKEIITNLIKLIDYALGVTYP